MTYELWNYRTHKFDNVYDWDIANLHDYIPQTYEYKREFKLRLMNGGNPREAAKAILVSHHDYDFVEFYRNHGGREAMYQDPGWKKVAQNIQMVSYMIQDRKTGRGWSMSAVDENTRPEMPIYTTVKFQKQKIGSIEIDEGYFYNDPQAHVHNGLINIWDYVWKSPESALYQEIIYPKDWWQAFKEKWFPDWLKEKYPAEYTKIVIDVMELYPTMKLKIPDHQPVLVINRMDYG